LNKTSRVVWFQFFAGLGAVAVVVALWHFFPVPEILAMIQQRVMGWGVWSAICYPILYACCNVLLLPGGILSIGGGFFFGLWWGFLIVLIGNVAGAAISFLIGRTGDTGCDGVSKDRRAFTRSNRRWNAKAGSSFFSANCIRFFPAV